MSDNDKWANWFNSAAWEAIWSKPEEHQNLKEQIDFMARKRLSGTGFECAVLAFGKPIVPVRDTAQMLADLEESRKVGGAA